MRRNASAGLAMGPALAILLAACGSGGASPSAAPAATEPPAATALFTGRATCRDVPSTDPSAENDSEAVTCDQVTTDPRLTGTLLSTALPAVVGDVPGVYIATSRWTLTNEGGTWTCDQLLVGVADSAGGADDVCVGEGTYAGLTAYVHRISNDLATTFGVLGWVEETP